MKALCIIFFLLIGIPLGVRAEDVNDGGPILFAWTDSTVTLHAAEQVLKKNHIVFVSYRQLYYSIDLSRSDAKRAAELIHGNTKLYPSLGHLKLNETEISKGAK